MNVKKWCDKMDIYYWKDRKWMIDTHYTGEVKGVRYPRKSDFKKDYKKLPITIPYDKSNNIDENLEKVFEIMNIRNPMETKQKQDWIRKNLQPNPHTSLSVGDVVKVGKNYYLAIGIGWKKMRW